MSIMKLRDTSTTFPSASEADDYCKCPAQWAFRWRLGWRLAETPMRFICGNAADAAFNAFYRPHTGLDPLAVYDAEMVRARERNPGIPEEEWQEWDGSYRKLVQEYLVKRLPAWENWDYVVGVQVPLKTPAAMRLDTLVRLKTGELAVVERKVMSGWADTEYEKMKYEMSFQPIYYCVGASEYFDEPVRKVVMDFALRGKPAKGRYKETPPSFDTHEFTVEDWKLDMWAASVEHVAVNMDCVDSALAAGDLPLVQLPRFTRNCVQVFGSKTHLCDWYRCCSMNMHPEQVVGVYEKIESER